MSEDSRHEFNSIIDHSYCIYDREVLNSIGNKKLDRISIVMNWVAHAIPDKFMTDDDYDLVDGLMQFGVITWYDIAEVEYWLSELTGG